MAALEISHPKTPSLSEPTTRGHTTPSTMLPTLFCMLNEECREPMADNPELFIAYTQPWLPTNHYIVLSHGIADQSHFMHCRHGEESCCWDRGMDPCWVFPEYWDCLNALVLEEDWTVNEFCMFPNFSSHATTNMRYGTVSDRCFARRVRAKTALHAVTSLLRNRFFKLANPHWNSINTSAE